MSHSFAKANHLVSASEPHSAEGDDDSYRYFKSPPTNIFKKLTFRTRAPSEANQQQEGRAKETIFTDSGKQIKQQMSFELQENTGSVKHDSTNRSEGMKHDADILYDSFEEDNNQSSSVIHSAQNRTGGFTGHNSVGKATNAAVTVSELHLYATSEADEAGATNPSNQRMSRQGTNRNLNFYKDNTAGTFQSVKTASFASDRSGSGRNSEMRSFNKSVYINTAVPSPVQPSAVQRQNSEQSSPPRATPNWNRTQQHFGFPDKSEL